MVKVTQNFLQCTVAKQNGGGAECVELFITLMKGMGEPTYELLESCAGMDYYTLYF